MSGPKDLLDESGVPVIQHAGAASDLEFCPPKEHLAQYLAGTLDTETSEWLEAHLLVCTTCSEALEALSLGIGTTGPMAASASTYSIVPMLMVWLGPEDAAFDAVVDALAALEQANWQVASIEEEELWAAKALPSSGRVGEPDARVLIQVLRELDEIFPPGGAVGIKIAVGPGIFTHRGPHVAIADVSRLREAPCLPGILRVDRSVTDFLPHLTDHFGISDSSGLKPWRSRRDVPTRGNLGLAARLEGLWVGLWEAVPRLELSLGVSRAHRDSTAQLNRGDRMHVKFRCAQGYTLYALGFAGDHLELLSPAPLRTAAGPETGTAEVTLPRSADWRVVILAVVGEWPRLGAALAELEQTPGTLVEQEEGLLGRLAVEGVTGGMCLAVHPKLEFLAFTPPDDR